MRIEKFPRRTIGIFGLFLLFVLFFNGFAAPAVARTAKKLESSLYRHEFHMSAPDKRSAADKEYQYKSYGNSNHEELLICVEGIDETFKRLPKKHVSNLETLVLSFENTGPRGRANTDTIIIRCDMSKDEKLKILIHEIGHLAYLNGSQKIKNEYERIWEISIDGDDFISAYAMADVYEDFAESYLAFVEFGSSFRKLADESEVLNAKYTFINENFFPGRTYNGSGDGMVEGREKVFDLTKIGSIR